MGTKQLTVFVENKHGALSEITKLLTAAGVNIRAMVLADTPDYGILRMIVSDTAGASEALSAGGILHKVVGITVIRLENTPGGLSSVLDTLVAHNINIEYMYAFVAVSGRDAYAALRFEDKDAALAVLAKEKIPILEAEAL
ncbi:MAG: ACT domain-containing protein [Christensenellales bacterium]|jgi:hypothetical protein